jgi:kynureninase
LAGWWGHAAPFEFTPDYRPAAGISRYLCGTQPILSMTALECGLDTVLAAEPLGRHAGPAQKIAGAHRPVYSHWLKSAVRATAWGWPRRVSTTMRGSQVCLTRTEGAYAIVQALIARGVIGDFRAGDGEVRQAPGHPALRPHAALHRF